MKKDIIIDIGANQGAFAIELAKRNPNCDVLAFEPEPKLFSDLQETGLMNLIAYDVAISDKEGIATFNVSHQADWGVSSLLEFNNKNMTVINIGVGVLI